MHRKEGRDIWARLGGASRWFWNTKWVQSIKESENAIESALRTDNFFLVLVNFVKWFAKVSITAIPFGLIFVALYFLLQWALEFVLTICGVVLLFWIAKPEKESAPNVGTAFSMVVWEDLAIKVVAPITGLPIEILGQSGNYVMENSYHFSIDVSITESIGTVVLRHRIERKLEKYLGIELKDIRQNKMVYVTGQSILIAPVWGGTARAV